MICQWTGARSVTLFHGQFATTKFRCIGVGGLPQFTLSTAYSSDSDIKPSLIIMWPICRCDSSKQIMQGSPIISWRWLKFLPQWRLSSTLDLKSFVVDWNNCDEDSVLLKRLLVSHFSRRYTVGLFSQWCSRQASQILNPLPGAWELIMLEPEGWLHQYTGGGYNCIMYLATAVLQVPEPWAQNLGYAIRYWRWTTLP